jgi:hypothetical protein
VVWYNIDGQLWHICRDEETMTVAEHEPGHNNYEDMPHFLRNQAEPKNENETVDYAQRSSYVDYPHFMNPNADCAMTTEQKSEAIAEAFKLVRETLKIVIPDLTDLAAATTALDRAFGVVHAKSIKISPRVQRFISGKR